MAKRDRSTRLDEGASDGFHRMLDGCGHLSKGGDYGISVKPLIRSKANLEGGLRVLLPLERSHCPSLISRAGQGLGDKGAAGWSNETDDTVTSDWYSGNKPKLIARYIRDLADSYDKAVFVSGVQGLDAVEVLVPACIGLEFAYYSNDIFSGETYLSTRYGTFQSFLTGGERKVDAVGVPCFVVNQLVDQDVQRAFQVVDCVSQNKRDFVGNGLVLFNKYLSLIGFLRKSAPQPEGSLLKEVFDEPVQIADVLIGPLDF